MQLNIIVLGDTGAGKSSLINMLVGENVAVTSSRATGCTFHAEPYEDGFGNRIFDTVGLNEPSKGKVPAREAFECLRKLLNSLRSGVNLIVFVVRKGRITETMTKNYKMFVRGICQGKVPVLLAISGCESDANEDAWFNENKGEFAKNGMKFDEVVSGCFKQPVDVTNAGLKEEISQSYKLTQKKLCGLIRSGKFEQSHSFGSFTEWLQMVIKNIFEDFSASHSGIDQVQPFASLVRNNEHAVHEQEPANRTQNVRQYGTSTYNSRTRAQYDQSGCCCNIC